MFTMTGDKLITPPESKPIEASEVQGYLMIPENQDDTIINMMIDAAIEFVESRLSIALITQEWEMTFDRWSSSGTDWWDGVVDGSISELHNGREIEKELNKYPLQSLESVTVDGKPASVDLFNVDTTRMPGRIVVKYGQVLPTNFKTANGYVVRYIAGYGGSPSDVPSFVRLGLLSLVGYMYSNRGDCSGAADAWHKSGAADYFSVVRDRRI